MTPEDFRNAAALVLTTAVNDLEYDLGQI